MSPLEIVVSVLMVLGTLMFLVTAIGMLRLSDALTRINVLAPALGAGLPLIMLAALVHDIDDNGFSWQNLISVVISIIAMLLVSSVASNVLARSAYRSDSPLDENTSFNDLAD